MKGNYGTHNVVEQCFLKKGGVLLLQVTDTSLYYLIGGVGSRNHRQIEQGV